MIARCGRQSWSLKRADLASLLGAWRRSMTASGGSKAVYTLSSRMSAFAGCGHVVPHVLGRNGPDSDSCSAANTTGNQSLCVAIGFADQSEESRMRRLEFIAGLGGAAAWPVATWAGQRVPPLIKNRQGQ
jgi:hypothetical protein